MKKTVRQYPLQRSPLYRLGRKRDLEELLYMQKGDSRRVKNFAEYNVFGKEKSSGGSRTIEAPCSEMKKWQRRVWDLMARIEKPDWVISATKGKSYKDNALRHRLNGYVMTMDIRSFYPSCIREYVYRLFRERLECAPDVAQCLTDICTYQGGIPTGSPASQAVAYFAYAKMFEEIESLARAYGCVFTLYVDDMTFSSRDNFSWRKLAYEVDGVLHKYGHRAKGSKTKYRLPCDFKIVTGVCLTPDSALVAPNKLRSKIVANMRSLKVGGDLSLLSRMRGQIQAADYVEGKRTFPGIRSELERIAEAR